MWFIYPILQEVAGYADVMGTVFKSWEAIDLTENLIKQLHNDLLQFTEKDQRHRGGYKTLDNHLEAFGSDGRSLGVIFETATPSETPGRMTDLVTWTRSTLQDEALHPLLAISIFVVVFLAIHPFQDGKGCLSRVLTTLLLLRTEYAYVPYSSPESIIEQSKEAYYLALRQTQGTINTDAVKITGVNRNTVKDHMKTLKANGHLNGHGSGRRPGTPDQRGFDICA